MVLVDALHKFFRSGKAATAGGASLHACCESMAIF
jgi:hypothetical protein